MNSRAYSPKPHFFKVLLPNFRDCMELPPSFVKKYTTEKDEKAGSATLLSPKGEEWNVSVHKNQLGSYTLSGDKWCACVEALDLEVGYFLLFRYEGNMTFSLTVFDLSSCEKAYSMVAEETKSVETKKASKDGHCFKIVSKFGEPITSYCKDCKCTRLEASISPTNLPPHNYMKIPVSFAEYSGLSKEQDSLTVVDGKGGSWSVTLRHAKEDSAKRGYYTRLGNGWRKFIHDNLLELGDKYVFELEGETHIMRVQIFKDTNGGGSWQNL